uniref:C2H2-type domain-containing protein n=1 Tax=Romanomermis culicivorax TaxID=13658 RepID=A0A915KYS9_ROMCU
MPIAQRVVNNPLIYADASARQNSMSYFQNRPLVRPMNGNVSVPIFTNGVQMPSTFGSTNVHQHYLPMMPQNSQRGTSIRQYDPLSMTATNGMIVPCQSIPFTQTVNAQLGHHSNNISEICNKAKISAADKHKQYLIEALSFRDYIPFKPEPIAEWTENFVIPQNNYPCKDCGDIYNTETCLQFHRQRRSMYITVRCILCRSDLTFYNKCTYHAHVNYHKENVGKMGRQNIDEASIFAEISVKSIDWSEVKLWFEDTAFKRLSDPESFLKYEIDLAEKTATQKLQCSECLTFFENHDALKLHITHYEPQQRKQFICPACQAVYFSRCGFTAHQRYAHSVVSPENGVRTSVDLPERVVNRMASHRRIPFLYLKKQQKINILG